MNLFSFSFRPLMAIILWSMPLIISGLLTLRWPILRGFSGATAQIVGTYLFLIISVQYVLGLLGLLTYNYISLAFLILIIIVFITWPRDILKSLLRIDNYLHKWKEAVKIFVEQLGGFVWILVAIGFFYFALSFQKCISPPIHIDCLFANLPQAVRWLQSGSIFEHSSPLSFYHQNNSLITTWFILPFNTDIFVNMQNIPGAFLSITSIYYLLRIVKTNRKLCLLVGLAFISLPVVNHWMWNQKQEILLTAYFLLSLCFILDYFYSKKGMSLIYGLISAGLVAGTKTYGLYYGLLLYLIALSFSIADKRTRKWFPVITGSILCFIFTLEWPLRNFIIWGNPIYPIDVSMFGKTIFQGNPNPWGDGGIGSALNLSIAENFSLKIIWPLMKDALERFGLVGLLSLLAMPISIIFVLKKKIEKVYLFLFIIVVGSYICYMFIPMGSASGIDITDTTYRWRSVYYAMPFHATAILLLSLNFDNKHIYITKVLEYTFLTQIVSGILFYFAHYEWIISKALIPLAQGISIAALITILGYDIIFKKKPKSFLIVLGGFLFFISLVSGFFFDRIHEYRVNKRIDNKEFNFFTNVSPDLLEWFENNVSGKTIVICPLEIGYGILAYPLFGSRFSNNIIIGQKFSQTYNPTSDIELVVISGKKREGSEIDSIILPSWVEIWGEKNGFQRVFSNGVQCVYQRKSE